MQELTKYLKLPFQFDTEKLVQDLSLILEEKWIEHFNKADYEGDWKVIPLLAEGGDETKIFAHPTSESTLSETSILRECRYLKEVIDTFRCPILSARILRLGIGSEIKPHRDHALGYEDGNFRLHIPIVTNPGVRFMLDGTQLTMLPGECWYTNVNFMHSVMNYGNTDRVHLVIDGGRNTWSDQIFFSLAPEASFQPIPKEEDSPETIERIIEELKRLNAPASRHLIDELTIKLSKMRTGNKGRLDGH